MAGDKNNFGDGATPIEDDFGALPQDTSGLGNLPPLSDFDSGEETSETGQLPPLGGLDSDSDVKFSTPGDLKMSTPAGSTPVGGGSQKTPDFSLGSSFTTPGDDIDTPEPAGGFGFQDIAADSDFSPETPEIGPGPDSDMDTPMFDRAFGGDSGEFGAVSTPRGGFSTPTQAMSTPVPMFDASPSPAGGDFGFDDDAFGGGGMAKGRPMASPQFDDSGTPIPDFSPDTELPAQQPTGAMEPRGRRGGMSRLAAAALVLVALAGGMFAGPFVPYVPDPRNKVIEEKDQEIASLKQQIRRVTEVAPTAGTPLTQEEIDKLASEAERLKAEIEASKSELARLQAELQLAQLELAGVKADIEEGSQQFVETDDALQALKQEIAITEARHEGLLAENERLTGQVGELEVAAARAQLTRDTLLHNLDLMIVQVEGGIGLTPAKYSRDGRLAKARELRDRVGGMNWVDPETLDAYTELYLSEMQIGSSREYFFAKIPVHDQLGSEFTKWAECLMNGNWSVYFRTIDGTNVGSYENISSTNIPQYQFREDLTANVKLEIEEQIVAARVPDYAEKVAVLEGKQAVYDTKTNLQKTFDSL